MKILGLCGSLRKTSTNGFVLQAAQKYFSQAHWEEFDLTRLPYFDPDHQFSQNLPEVVSEFRKVAASSEGQWAQESLVEILKTMDFAIGKEQTLLLQGARSKINERGEFKNKEDEIQFRGFCQQWAK